MRPIKNILFPTDFSSCSEEAFPHALLLARSSGAVLHILHVISDVEGDVYSPLRFSPEAAVQQKSPDVLVWDLLNDLVNRHDTDDIQVQLVERRSMAVEDAILSYAESSRADLVVMGTHGRRGLQHWFLGSVAEALVNHAPCSVLTVRSLGAPTDQAPTVRRILVPLSSAPHARPLLKVAKKWALAYGASLDLLHVVEPPTVTNTLTGLFSIADLSPDLQAGAERALKRLHLDTNGATLEARVHVVEGNAASEIVRFAEKEDIDLILMATRGLAGIGHFLAGSVTERVVRRAPYPVLTARLTSAVAPGDRLSGEPLPTESPRSPDLAP